MLNAKAFANATTTVAITLFIICRLVAWITPDLLFQVGQSLFHTIQVESNQTSTSLSFGALLLGLVSAAAITWVSTYSAIALYNKWTQK